MNRPKSVSLELQKLEMTKRLQKLALFISDVDDGGAGMACQRVYDELNALTGNSCGWLAAATRRPSGAVSAGGWPSFSALVVFEMLRRIHRNECCKTRAEHRFNAFNISRIVGRVNPRVLCLHNIHQKASFDLLAVLPKSLPIFIYLHDMWYLTGYCCHSMGCDKYHDGCRGACPQWGNWEVPTRQADKEWQRRQQYFLHNAHRVRLIAPSRWMANCAESRFNGKIAVEHIANPIDTDVYKPIGEKRHVRQLLGLDGDKPLILCGAVTMRDKHKGAEYLIDALGRLRQRMRTQFTVAQFGSGNLSIPDVVALGTIRDPQLLNLYYNAATAFVLPSLAESFGMVYAEAMAAGTPCVAFDNTACGEIVRDGVTGYLAKSADVDALTNAIARALDAGDSNPLGRNCRAHVVSKYDVHMVGRQHLKLIESVLSK